MYQTNSIPDLHYLFVYFLLINEMRTQQNKQDKYMYKKKEKRLPHTRALKKYVEEKKNEKTEQIVHCLCQCAAKKKEKG